MDWCACTKYKDNTTMKQPLLLAFILSLVGCVGTTPEQRQDARFMEKIHQASEESVREARCLAGYLESGARTNYKAFYVNEGWSCRVN